MSDERASVGVAFDAAGFDQHDPIPRRLAEAGLAIGGDRNHPSLEREVVLVRHQAALASERRSMSSRSGRLAQGFAIGRAGVCPRVPLRLCKTLGSLLEKSLFSGSSFR